MTTDLFKDMSKYLPAQLVPGIMAFISIPVITRLFAPNEFGNYALVIAAVSVATMAVGWLSISIVRFYPAYEQAGKLKDFFTTVFRMTLISVGVISIVCSLTLFFMESRISPALYRLMWIGIPLFITTSFFLVFIEFFRARRQIGLFSLFKVWKSITAIIFGVLLVVLCNFGIDGLLWGTLLSLGIAFPFLWAVSLGTSSQRSKSISLSLMAEMAKYGFPLVIGNLAAWMLSLSDRFILEVYRGSAEVGIYAASYNISEQGIMMISALFGLTSGSIVYRIWEKSGEDQCKLFLSKITRYYLIIGIPASAGLIALARPLVRLLTGFQYHEGCTIVPFVVAGIFLLGLQQRFYPALNVHKKTRLIMISIIASGVFNVLLNIIFIPHYGYRAAAVTTFVSYVCVLILTVYFSRRYLVWPFPFRSLLNVSLASVLMGGAVYFIGNNATSSLPVNIILGVGAGPLIYFPALFLLTEFSKEERELFHSAKRQIFKYGIKRTA